MKLLNLLIMLGTIRTGLSDLLGKIRRWNSGIALIDVAVNLLFVLLQEVLVTEFLLADLTVGIEIDQI